MPAVSGVDNVVKSDERVAEKISLKKPRMYRVILFNDDYTTMDFVVEILITVFNKPAAEATKIMLDVHQKGSGTCGIYTHDVAVTKINRVHKLAQENQFPLKCGIEEA